MEIIIALIAIVIIVIQFLLVRKNIRDTKAQIKIQNNKYAKLLSQKKSSEVRLGKIGENLAPFTDAWPYDPNGFRFLGNPVDGVQFTEDEILFMEIKTGKARLTHSQKLAKKLVKEGKVRFATFRVDDKGATLKVEENNF